jgi:voltage-gated potassium channel
MDIRRGYAGLVLADDLAASAGRYDAPVQTPDRPHPLVPLDEATVHVRVSHPGYELFILALTLLSLGNLVILALPLDPQVNTVIFIVDGLLCIFFMADFVWRLYSAPSKRAYLRFGWLDFLGSLPIPLFRLFRLYRASITIRFIQAAGGRKIVRALVRQRGESVVVFVGFVTIIVLEIASAAVLVAESKNPDANIQNGGDALWWAWISVTSVGYGDKYPITTWGRIIGSILVGVGIALITTITGFIASRLLPRSAAEAAEPPLVVDIPAWAAPGAGAGDTFAEPSTDPHVTDPHAKDPPSESS